MEEEVHRQIQNEIAIINYMEMPLYEFLMNNNVLFQCKLNCISRILLHCAPFFVAQDLE